MFILMLKVTFRQILEYLSGSVQICTDSQAVLNMGCANNFRDEAASVWVPLAAQAQGLCGLCRLDCPERTGVLWRRPPNTLVPGNCNCWQHFEKKTVRKVIIAGNCNCNILEKKTVRKVIIASNCNCSILKKKQAETFPGWNCVNFSHVFVGYQAKFPWFY